MRVEENTSCDNLYLYILSWVDAHANRPTRARWTAKANVALLGATERGASTLLFKESFLFSEHSSLDASLIQAYRETHYRVDGTSDMTLLVDTHSLELAALHLKHGVSCSGFITACNPNGVTLPKEVNTKRQADLGVELQHRGLNYLVGIGQHPNNGWPGEPSYLVLGLDLETAKDLALRLEQNAFLWSSEEAVPKLVLLK